MTIISIRTTVLIIFAIVIDVIGISRTLYFVIRPQCHQKQIILTYIKHFSAPSKLYMFKKKNYTDLNNIGSSTPPTLLTIFAGVSTWSRSSWARWVGAVEHFQFRLVGWCGRTYEQSARSEREETRFNPQAPRAQLNLSYFQLTVDLRHLKNLPKVT